MKFVAWLCDRQWVRMIQAESSDGDLQRRSAVSRAADAAIKRVSVMTDSSSLLTGLSRANSSSVPVPTAEQQSPRRHQARAEAGSPYHPSSQQLSSRA